MIDKSKINEGDKVKIRYQGLVSEDFTEVLGGTFNSLLVGEFYLGWESVEVFDHKPSFKAYEDAVAVAEEALKNAKEQLAKAKSETELSGKDLVGKPVSVDWPDWGIGSKRTFLVESYSLYLDAYLVNGCFYKRDKFRVV